MIAQIFTDDPIAAIPLEKKLHLQNISFAHYQPGAYIYADWFILISPIWCDGKFVASETVWKKYFELKKDETLQKTKLIVAGYDRLQHPNYLWLLNLPEDLFHFFEHAKSSAQNWVPVQVMGLDMAAQLRRFYLGHGKDSVLAAFDSIAIKVYDIEKYRHTMPFQAIIDEDAGLVSPEKLSHLWLNFRIRWGHYFAYASCLPFYLRLLELEEISNNIHIFFQTGCTDVILFDENNVAVHIRRIKNILEECSTYAS